MPESAANRIITEANLTDKLTEIACNVLDEGAVGDATDTGGTNDAAAFQKAMDKAWGTFGQGGTILIPPGVYHLASAVQLRSNVRIIGYGATIRKYSTSVNYSAFWALSGSAQGYGSSVANVTIEGLTFRGSFTAGALTGCGITLHHADQVTIKNCAWVEAIISGHAIDSMGTRGLKVEDCVFKGFLPQTDREYTEAIQLDYSLISSVINDAPASYDGLPTIDTTVEGCRFVPLTIGATTHPAPNPLGSHSRVHGMWIDNIKFINNTVEGCHQPVTTDAFALSTRGWLHFFCARNVQIIGNKFKNVDNRAARVIGAFAISSGTTVANAGVAGAAAEAMTPMPMRGLLVEGNTFEGFTNDALEPLINITGTSATNGRNIRVINNTLRDSFSTPGVSGDKGADFIYLADITGATINDNYLDVARSLIYGFRVKKINISGGQLINLGAYITRFSTSTDVQITNLFVDGHGAGHYFYTTCTNIHIDGGSILNGRADAFRAKHISHSGTTEWSVRNVRIPADGNLFTAAIDGFSTTTKGKVKDNFAAGWTVDNFVNLGTGSVVTETENVF